MLIYKVSYNSCSRKLEWLPSHWMPQHNNQQRFSPSLVSIVGYCQSIIWNSSSIIYLIILIYLTFLYSLSVINSSCYIVIREDFSGIAWSNMPRVSSACVGRIDSLLFCFSFPRKQSVAAIDSDVVYDGLLSLCWHLFLSHRSYILGVSVADISILFIYAYLLRICFIFHISDGW